MIEPRPLLRRLWLLTGAGLLVQLIIGAVAWPYLPDRLRVVTRADLTDAEGSRTEAVLTMPIILLAITLFMSFAIWFSARRPRPGDNFSGLTKRWIVLVVVLTTLEVAIIDGGLR